MEETRRNWVIEAKRRDCQTEGQTIVKIEGKEMSIEKVSLNLVIRWSLVSFARRVSEEWLELAA